MAGAREGAFRELISPFLRAKIEEAAQRFGEASPQHAALTRQYVKSPQEDFLQTSERGRHYQSEIHISFENQPVIGVERLYKRTILIEPTTVCAAHCRWCLRGQYPIQTMKPEQILHAARFIGADFQRDDISEVLITGGDPLMSLNLLRCTLDALQTHAPNVRTVRIGSRVPFQDPERVSGAMLELFSGYRHFRFELGCNVNHPIEFWPESITAIRRLQDIGFRIYNQHPLLKGVNDDFDTLVELYSLLRDHDIEAHYLFHAIPLRGMRHHRTSLERGLKLAARISACGAFSGRAKPRYAVLSDIGKIVLYQGTVVDRRDSDNAVLLRSGFKLEERRRWNPSWPIPDSVVLDNDGTMMTWYLDGTDQDEELKYPTSQGAKG
ncbi:MAG: radical SAM protein [Alphaproteobacteria bacterium]|nr:radical SAM protein [Alphaproteobacteria bacterium]